MTSRRHVTAESFVKRKKKARPKLPAILRIISPVNFVGLGLALGLGVLLHVKGTPHMLFQYTYSGSKNYKTSCTYIGLNPQTVSASGGRCSVFRLLKEAQ